MSCLIRRGRIQVARGIARGVPAGSSPHPIISESLDVRWRGKERAANFPFPNKKSRLVLRNGPAFLCDFGLKTTSSPVVGRPSAAGLFCQFHFGSLANDLIDLAVELTHLHLHCEVEFRGDDAASFCIEVDRAASFR